MKHGSWAKLSLMLAGTLLVGGCGQADFSEAEKGVRSFLKDPDSAQFRELREVSGGVCGEYNAKNAMGGYVGYRPFKWARQNGTVVTVADDGKIVRLDGEEMLQSVTMEFYCGASQ